MLATARRIALAEAQGFAGSAAGWTLSIAASLNGGAARLGLLADRSGERSVRGALACRSFSRLGPLPDVALSMTQRAASGKSAACSSIGRMRRRLLPIEHGRLMLWRMERARANDDMEILLKGPRPLGRRHARLIDENIRAEVKARGPDRRLSDMMAPRARAAGGAGATTKHAFEWLCVLGRPHHHPFARAASSGSYDLPERVIPPDDDSTPLP